MYTRVTKESLRQALFRDHLVCKSVCGGEKYGAPGTTRTCDPLIRSQVLYPAELRVLVKVNGK